MNIADCKKAKCEFLDEENEFCLDCSHKLHNVGGCGIADEALLIERNLLEKTDNITNQIMDAVRSALKLNEDSDTDDKLYSDIHNIIKTTITPSDEA